MKKTFLALAFDALFTGLYVALVLLLLVAGMSDYAEAAGEDEVTSGRLQRFSIDGRRIDDAPLLQTEVEMHVSGMLARVKVIQHFSNPGREWLEGVYVFPLPENSAVDRMRLHIGERIIEGEIQERAQARKTFEKAKAEGKRASLVSQERPNIFTTRLANMGPGETIQVEIEYQQNLDYDQGGFELRFPLVVGPRYIPGRPLTVDETGPVEVQGWSPDTDRVPDASRITPPVADPKDDPLNPVSLNIELDAGVELQALRSRYHELEQQQDEQGVYHLRLKQGQVPADRDFVLDWTPKTGDAPRAALFTEHWRDADYALLMLLPPALESESQPQPRELIFVIDTSGSMHGPSLEQARQALQMALLRLHPQDSFNVIQFNSTTEALFGRAMAATPEHIQRAMSYVAGLRADGGTEMLPALNRALAYQGEGGRLRQIVFLTDGSVGNEEELFTLIQNRLGDSRLFTIGLGSAPNGHFMRRAAEFGRGDFTYIGATTEVREQMESLFRKLEHPALTDIRISGQDMNGIERYPATVPDLYLGEPLWLALKADQLPAELSIEGHFGERIWHETLPLHSSQGESGVHTLWARRKLDELQAELVRGGIPEEVREKSLQVALEHQLVSRYTSLVAVDKTPARLSNETLKSRMLPTNLPAGWSAEKVFGHLPKTATPAPLHLVLGLMLLLSALLLWQRDREKKGEVA